MPNFFSNTEDVIFSLTVYTVLSHPDHQFWKCGPYWIRNTDFAATGIRPSPPASQFLIGTQYSHNNTQIPILVLSDLSLNWKPSYYRS